VGLARVLRRPRSVRLYRLEQPGRLARNRARCLDAPDGTTMHPRRRLPPRRELTAQERAQYVEVLARRDRIVSPEERAASLAALEAFIAAATTKTLDRVASNNLKHLRPFQPDES
jgi:hypothetical protein